MLNKYLSSKTKKGLKQLQTSLLVLAAAAVGTIVLTVSHASGLPPTVSITSPVNNAVVSGTTTLSSSAVDNSGSGMNNVQFKLDSTNLGSSVTTTPYNYSWDTTTESNGFHSISALATDNDSDSTTSSSITVLVCNEPTLYGDVDCDGSVTGHDLSLLLANYGANYSPAEFDGGNSVEGHDLSILLDNYAKTVPVVSLSASTSGSSSTLTWSSINATACTASASPTDSTWSGTEALSGTQSVSPASTTTYSISCSGPGGSYNASAEVMAEVAFHVPTYDRSGAGSAPTATVHQWLTFEETQSEGTATALSQCHSGSTVYCQVIPYIDTNIYYPSDPPPYNAGSSGVTFTPGETWYQHVPGSTTDRIYTTAYSGGYLMNPATVGLQSWWKSTVNNTNVPMYNGLDWLFSDDNATGVPLYGWVDNNSQGTSVTYSNELGTNSLYLAAHESMANALTTSGGAAIPQIDNAIEDCGNPYEVIGQQLPLLTGPTKSLLAEGCPWNGSANMQWMSGLLDDAAWIDHHTNGFMTLLSYDTAAGNAAARRVQQATVMLMYYPNNSYDGVVDWADLESDSGDMSVWPEEGIVPGTALQTMADPGSCSFFTSGSGSYCPSGGHNNIQAPTAGVFIREFSNCYDKGVAFGKCAAVVNSTASQVAIQPSWLAQSYTHEITFNGGDVQSGGTVSLSGATFTPGTSCTGSVTCVPSDDAALLSP